ncbi:MAG: hypothetical protein GY833_09520 [Aestuariibacter sp.]|nr:hypothetical protein [Aestuariibacter sp.]
MKDDSEREAIFAHWADPKRAARDPRQFVLMRPLNRTNPTRIYTGRFTDYSAGEIPWLHRRRWTCNELRIRNLIHGANLNVNYGYAYTEGINRTRQREWEAAQERVSVTERQLTDCRAAVHNLRQCLADLQSTYASQHHDLQEQLKQRRLDVQRRQRLGQTTTRAMQRVNRLRRKLDDLKQRFCKRQRRLLEQLYDQQSRSYCLNERLHHRLALRDAIDTETLCRERDLEKDQVMLDLQVLLANLHDWSAKYYFDSPWRNLSLKKATQMIYRKAGQVTWYNDRIEVVLKPYRYSDQQSAMETSCARFNARNVRWRDGRRIHISVAPPK